MLGLPKLSHILLTAVGIYFVTSLWTFYQLFSQPPPPCQSGICLPSWLARDPKLELHLYTTTRKPSHPTRIPYYFRYGDALCDVFGKMSIVSRGISFQYFSKITSSPISDLKLLLKMENFSVNESFRQNLNVTIPSKVRQVRVLRKRPIKI